MSGSLEEARTFRRAREKIEGGDPKDASDGIATMIELSLNAQTYQLRLWARNFLTQNYNVTFVENDDETAIQTSPVQG